jgi:conjugal transfer/type IV secretion protein DotA/TraY
MKIIRSILLAATLAISFVIGAPAFADTTAQQTAAQSATIKSIFDVKTDYGNDLAQKWMKQLFGSFIFTQSPTGGQSASGTGGSSSDVTVLTTAIGFSNVLAMIFGIVVVSYMFIAGSMNTAHHGEALGKNWSSVWLPVRLATGFGLIMPAGSFGGGAVSTIQALTIWIILVGSNAANVLWNTISDKVSSGVSMNSNVMLSANVSKQLASMLSCTYSYMNVTGNNIAFFTDTVGVTNSTSKAVKDGEYLTLPKLDAKMDAYNIQFADGGACGKVEFRWTNKWMPNETSTSTFTFLQEAKKAGNEAAKQAFFTHLNQMIDAINMMHKSTASGGLGGPDGIVASGASVNTADGSDISAAQQKYNDVANKLFAAASDMSIQLPIDVSNAMTTKDFTAAFATEIKKGGWGSAGLWFMRVGSVQNMVSEVTGSFSDGVSPATPSLGWFWDKICSTDCEKQEASINAGQQMALGLFQKGASNFIAANKEAQVKAAASSTAMPTVDLRINMAMEANGGAGCVADSCTQMNGADTSSMNISRSLLSMLATTTDDVKLQGNSSVTDTTGVASPFATAAAMGNMSINIMQGMYAAAAIGSIASKAGDIGGDMNPAGKVMKAVGGIAGSAATVLFGIGTYFGAIGITLAFVIPFMPALLWMMMMIGYLLAVIEAMIASPFATIMMVTPEGEGISGTRMERAISLLALCVLRPSLMVMGLVAAITLSSVSFSIFNQFFWYTAESSITGSILTILVLVGMYTAGLFQICKHSISVMTKLPDQILEWMGMNASRAFGEQDAMGAAEKGAEGGTKAAQGTMDTIAKDMKNRINRKTNHGI